MHSRLGGLLVQMHRGRARTTGSEVAHVSNRRVAWSLMRKGLKSYSKSLKGASEDYHAGEWHGCALGR